MERALAQEQMTRLDLEYTEFIKPGASMESRHFRTRQKNI